MLLNEMARLNDYVAQVTHFSQEQYFPVSNFGLAMFSPECVFLKLIETSS